MQLGFSRPQQHFKAEIRLALSSFCIGCGTLGQQQQQQQQQQRRFLLRLGTYCLIRWNRPEKALCSRLNVKHLYLKKICGTNQASRKYTCYKSFQVRLLTDTM